MSKVTVIDSDLASLFDSVDGKLYNLRNAVSVSDEVPDDPATATSFVYKLTAANAGYPAGATVGILFTKTGGDHVLVSNLGIHIRTNGAWVHVAGGTGGGLQPGDLGPIEDALAQLQIEVGDQATDIVNIQDEQTTQNESIAEIETGQTTQNQRISALEKSGRGPLSRALQDFDAGLEEVAQAGDRTYTAPFDSVVEFNLKAPVTITGDSDGIVQTNLPDDNVIGFSGLANNIYKIIALDVTGVPANDTVDIVSYRIPEHNNIIHHLVRVANGNYVLGNPHPTVENSNDTNVGNAVSATTAYQDGDWVVISPAPRGTDGVEFNVVVRRANGTIIQANTITFNDPEALAQLHLDTLYFHTHPGDNTQAAYVTKAVVGEHSGQHYLTHSTLAGFDFTDDELGLASTSAGATKLEFHKPMKFTMPVEFADIQAVLYRDGDGNIHTLGTSTGTTGLTQAEVEQLIAEIKLEDLADTPDSLGGAGQVLTISTDRSETVWQASNTATWAREWEYR